MSFFKKGIRVLCAFAHPDDEALSCTGTLVKLVDEFEAEIDVIFFTDGVSARGVLEGRSHEARRFAEVLGANEPHFFDFPDNQLDSLPLLGLIKAFENRVIDARYDLVITHFRSDLNIDHRIVHQVVMTAYRPLAESNRPSILSAHVKSSTEWAPVEDPFSPSIFVDVSPYKHRIFELLACYESEINLGLHPRSIENYASNLRVNGISVGCSLAESFVASRIIL